MFKDKNFLLKKKIIEQKNIIKLHAEEIKKERDNTETVKKTLGSKIQLLKDDMMTIMKEWEKKCNEQVNVI